MNILMLTGAIGVFGGLGAMSRFLIGHVVSKKFMLDSAWATLCVNVLGTTIAALIFVWLDHKMTDTGVATTYRNLLFTGFCGGLTTFSSFIVDSNRLAKISLIHTGSYMLANIVIAWIIFASILHFFKIG